MAPALSSGGLTIHVPETLSSPVLSPRSPSGLHFPRALFQALLPIPATSTGRGGRARATASLLLQSGKVARDQPQTDYQGAGNSRWKKSNRCFTRSRFLSGPRRSCLQFVGFDTAEHRRRGARPSEQGIPAQDVWVRGDQAEPQGEVQTTCGARVLQKWSDTQWHGLCHLLTANPTKETERHTQAHGVFTDGKEHHRGTNATFRRPFYPEAIRPHNQVLRISTGLGRGRPACGATLKNIIII